mgnify:CR=1 FL=1
MRGKEQFLAAALIFGVVTTACDLDGLGAGRTPLTLSKLLEDEHQYKQNGQLIQLTLDENLILQTRTDIRRAVKEKGWLKAHGVKETNRQVFDMALRDSLSEEQKALLEGFRNEGNEIVIPSGTKLNLVGTTFPASEPDGYFAFDIQEVIPQK